MIIMIRLSITGEVKVRTGEGKIRDCGFNIPKATT